MDTPSASLILYLSSSIVFIVLPQNKEVIAENKFTFGREREPATLTSNFLE